MKMEIEEARNTARVLDLIGYALQVLKHTKDITRGPVTLEAALQELKAEDRTLQMIDNTAMYEAIGVDPEKLQTAINRLRAHYLRHWQEPVEKD